MAKIKGLLDTNQLEQLELNMGPSEFSKFMYYFTLELESNIKGIEESAEKADIDKLIKLTDLLKTRTLTVGANLLSEESIKLQCACIKQEKEEILKSIKTVKEISEITLNAIRDILLISFFYILATDKKSHFNL